MKHTSSDLAFRVAQLVTWSAICNDERPPPEFDRPQPAGYVTRRAADLIEIDRISAKIEALTEFAARAMLTSGPDELPRVVENMMRELASQAEAIRSRTTEGQSDG